MKSKYHKFLIVSTVALMLGGAYLHFSNDINSTGDMLPVAYGSSLSSSVGVESSETNVQNEKISADVAFLTTLASLKKIKIDTTIFENKSFNKLENNAVKIEKVTAGRKNPFAPIGSYEATSSSVVSKVVTDLPTQITEKSVVLNGTINESGAKDTFFEYGTTAELGVVTPVVKQSLVGTFIKNVLGLSPKTDYFYKACAKVNNTTLCGDVVSFTTN